MNIIPIRSAAAADNLPVSLAPQPIEVAEPRYVRGILGESVTLTRCDTTGLLAIDDGLVCTDAHLCIDRMRQLRDALDAVIAEVEGRSADAKVIPIQRGEPNDAA